VIVIGAYPASFAVDTAPKSAIADLTDVLDQIVPTSVGVHVLPFYPSSGDFGFAPDDWYQVGRQFGSWDDVIQLARRRRLVIDGIYNHVGLGHSYARQFLRDPAGMAEVLHAYRRENPLEAPLSPRGGPVLRQRVIAGDTWQTWQTFSDSSIDIRLDSPVVMREVERHAIMIARKIATFAVQAGLQPIAQLDSDSQALKYFPVSLGYDVPTIDYAFSAQIVLAVLSGQVQSLADHLRSTWKIASVIVRPPRTHDGILLLSDQLSVQLQRRLVAEAERLSLPIRISNDEAYELTSSLPFICALGVDKAAMRRRLLLITALSALIPGWCYLYLPALMGDIPEERAIAERGSDPRGLNRLPISAECRETYMRSGARMTTYMLLDQLASLRTATAAGEDKVRGGADALSESVLRLNLPGSGLVALFNFDPSRAARAPDVSTSAVVLANGVRGDEVGPLGFGVWAILQPRV
jgi:hypothetical protein